MKPKPTLNFHAVFLILKDTASLISWIKAWLILIDIFLFKRLNEPHRVRRSDSECLIAIALKNYNLKCLDLSNDVILKSMVVK